MATQVGKMKATSINGVKMYSISGQQSLAAWLPPKKLKSFRKNKDYRQRVDLIQDLWFAAATTKIKATPDGQFIIASGTYPPQVKVYELKELSLKFERHLVSEILDFQVLDDDYSKLAFLCADRSVCLHARYGSHYSLRIPRMGRDITYDRWSCDLLCAASSPDIYRINLEQGRFLSSLNTQSQAINIVCQSPVHGLIACGGDDGAVECFDPRMKSAAGRIDAVAPSGDVDQEITALRFDEVGGFHMAVGSSAGKVLVYDLRSSSPIQIKDHMYGSPIVDIKWHQTLNSSRAKLISADNHIIRIWDPETGDGMTSIEPSGGTINDVCIFKQSGLMLLALDSSQIPSYFLPALGPAPKWCSHLENQTEEMEESAQTTIYDDFKFLTKEDLERLNLTNLIGTNLLRAELHGYFIDYRLYKKAQALADPFAYDAYRQKKLEEKMEAERASRITIRRKLPKVNRTLAARLLENEEAEEAGVEIAEDTTAKKASKKKKGLSSELLKDTRFAALFENKEFEVDEFSREYLSLHPNSSTKKKPSLIEEHFEPVLDGDERNSDSDVSAPPHSSEDELDEEGSRKAQKWNTARFPRLYEVKDERHAEAFWNSVSLANEDDLPLGERAAALQAKQNLGDANGVKKGPGGSREVSFMSKSSTKFNKDEDDEPDERSRRGTRSLGLKPDRPHFGGRGRSRGRGRGRGPRGGGRGNSRGRGRR